MGTSVLEAVREAWRADPVLAAIVPIDSVFIGQPNPGAGQPCVGLVSATHERSLGTSATQYTAIDIQAVAEAADPETLETLADLIRQRLHTWTATRFQSLRLAAVKTEIAQDADAPQALWLGRYTLSFEAICTTTTTTTSTTTTTTTTAP